MVVIEETHRDNINSLTARNAQNAVSLPQDGGQDLITLPIEQVGPEPQ